MHAGPYVLAALVYCLSISVKAHAQAEGTTVDSCNYNGVDDTNDLEQTVCLYGDASGVTAAITTDSWAYEDQQNWPSGDLYVVGLGAEGQVFDSSNNLTLDTGMSDNGPYGSIVQANNAALPIAYTYSTFTPQANIWYTLNGFYSYCYDSSGTGSDSCSWTSGYQGLSTQAMVTSSMLTPTLSVSSNLSPSYGSQQVTFRLNAENEPDVGTVSFYDNGTYLAAASLVQYSATNLVPYSQQFGNSPWIGYCGSTSNMTLNESDVAAPDGTNTAAGFVTPSTSACDGSQPSRGLWTTIPSGLQTGQTYTASLWMRGAVGGEVVNFGLNDCSTIPATLTTSWQRYSVTYRSIPSGIANCSTGTRGFEFADWVANNTFYAWGAQTEQAAVLGPYIPTGSTPGSGSGFESYLNPMTLAVGTHSITAVWPGDANTNSVTSQPFIQVVNPPLYDSGTVSLNVNGTQQTVSFGQGSTGTSIAQSLASAFSGSSQFSVSSYGDMLNIKGAGTGPSTDYSYSLSVSYDSGDFASPSFSPSQASGNLQGGTSGGPVALYSYNAAGGYDANGNVLAYTDSVMGGWQFGYDGGNRLVTASNTALPLPGTVNPGPPAWAQNLCWAYDSVGNSPNRECYTCLRKHSLLPLRSACVRLHAEVAKLADALA